MSPGPTVVLPVSELSGTLLLMTLNGTVFFPEWAPKPILSIYCDVRECVALSVGNRKQKNRHCIAKIARKFFCCIFGC